MPVIDAIAPVMIGLITRCEQLVFRAVRSGAAWVAADPAGGIDVAIEMERRSRHAARPRRTPTRAAPIFERDPS